VSAHGKKVVLQEFKEEAMAQSQSVSKKKCREKFSF